MSGVWEGPIPTDLQTDCLIKENGHAQMVVGRADPARSYSLPHLASQSCLSAHTTRHPVSRRDTAAPTTTIILSERTQDSRVTEQRKPHVRSSPDRLGQVGRGCVVGGNTGGDAV